MITLFWVKSKNQAGVRQRKFTFGNNGVESTHDALIKYQAMTCGFNIHLFGTRSKPSFLSAHTSAYSS